MVGERGPEIFVPQMAGRIVPNGGGNGGGPPVINIVVNGARGNQEISSMVMQGVIAGIGANNKAQQRSAALSA